MQIATRALITKTTALTSAESQENSTMSNKHKNPTISFRVSNYERKAIETRILASGMMKKDYFVRSCIYNRICVVGMKKVCIPTEG
jgi:hypothetical protein